MFGWGQVLAPYVCIWVCDLSCLSLSCPGPLCCIQVNCTSLLLFLKLGHPGSLQQRHLGSEFSHECFAQGHRGKCLHQQLPSEAFQLYLLIGLTNSVFFFPAILNIVSLCSWKSKLYNMYQAWLSRPPDHLWVSDPCCHRWFLTVPVPKEAPLHIP